VKVRRAMALLVLIGLASASSASAKSRPAYRPGKTWSWTFATDTLGQAPTNTSVFGGTWVVLADSSAAPAPSPAVSAPAAATPAPTDSAVATPAPSDSAAAVRPDSAVATPAPSDSAAAPRPDSAVVTAAPVPAAPPLPRFLRQSEGDDGQRFHSIEFKKPVLEDMKASVRFRIVSAELDPSAGILFQLDPKGKNGYLVRVRGEEQDIVAHYLLGGKRRDLKFVKIAPLETGTWHTIAVSRKGSLLTASYDGVELIQLRDERFSKGSVGLWTEDDTVADFSDLKLTTQ